jgi:hypothetical protein
VGLAPSLLCSDDAVPPRHAGRRPRIAAIYTELREFSHAYHLLEAHMAPFLFNGKLVDPGVDVVSWYADQFPEKDMTREAAARLKVPLYDSIAGALTLGTDSLAVDGILLIGEHGTYPRTDRGVVMYPRKEFFDQCVAVMDRSRRYVPIFNDKHLSWRWDWAKEMYDVAKDRGIPFMAGSSVPLSQRIPAIEIPPGEEIVEAVSIHGGPLESYDFHGLEDLQSIVESRKGGETGVSSIQVLKGNALLDAAKQGRWSLELAEAAMRTELGDAFTGFAAGGPTAARHGLLVDYKDGLRGVVLAVGANGDRWSCASRLKNGQTQAFRWYPGPWGNRNLFRALSYAIQEFFITGKSPYPVERTLLVTGLVEAEVQSYHADGRRIETPHLEFAYAATDFSGVRESGKSWKVLTKDLPQPPRFEPGDAKTLQVSRGRQSPVSPM